MNRLISILRFDEGCATYEITPQDDHYAARLLKSTGKDEWPASVSFNRNGLQPGSDELAHPVAERLAAVLLQAGGSDDISL